MSHAIHVTNSSGPFVTCEQQTLVDATGALQTLEDAKTAAQAYATERDKKPEPGANVVKIGASAFQGCKKLAKVTVKSKKLKSIGKKAFKSTSSKIKVKVPKAKKAAYKKMLKKAGLSKKGKVK